MSDYWVSKGKYFCFYCKIYIADDKPSRNQHEGGLKHKGNVERYVRNVYKKGEQQTRDKATEAAQMAQINAAAAAATGIAYTPDPPVASSSKRRGGGDSSDPYANYSDATSLGLVDESTQAAFAAQQAQAQAAAEAKRLEGSVGQWQAVQQQSTASSSKRPLEEDDADAPSRLVSSKSFVKEKVATAPEDLYDPAATIKLKLKKKPKLEEVDPVPVKQEEEKPKFKGFKLAFTRTNGATDSQPGSQSQSQPQAQTPDQDQPAPIKTEEEPSNAPTTIETTAETDSPTLFKKRKGARSGQDGSSRRRG